MKNSNHLTKLALSVIVPFLATWLISDREFSADVLLGAYTISGLFFLTATSYLPHRVFAGTKEVRKPTRRWIHLSLKRTAHARTAPHDEKIPA